MNAATYASNRGRQEARQEDCYTFEVSLSYVV